MMMMILYMICIYIWIYYINIHIQILYQYLKQYIYIYIVHIGSGNTMIKTMYRNVISFSGWCYYKKKRLQNWNYEYGFEWISLHIAAYHYPRTKHTINWYILAMWLIFHESGGCAQFHSHLLPPVNLNISGSFSLSLVNVKFLLVVFLC